MPAEFMFVQVSQRGRQFSGDLPVVVVVSERGGVSEDGFQRGGGQRWVITQPPLALERDHAGAVAAPRHGPAVVFRQESSTLVCAKSTPLKSKAG